MYTEPKSYLDVTSGYVLCGICRLPCVYRFIGYVKELTGCVLGTLGVCNKYFLGTYLVLKWVLESLSMRTRL